MVETSEHVEIMIRIVPQGNDAFGLEISGPSGEAGVQVARDEFLPPVLQQQLRQIGQRRSPVEDAAQLGRTLYAHLFPPPLEANLERARAIAGPDLLRLYVHCELPEVAAVPWELLYDPRRRLFLALDPATGLVRHTKVAEPVAEREAGTALRILALHVAPADAPTLELDAARQALEEALAGFVEAGQVSIDFVPSPVTAEALQERLAGEPYDVLYFAGHSTDRTLLLEDEQRRGRSLPVEQLREMLQGQPPYLLVLSADDTGAPDGSRRSPRRAGGQALPSLAAALVQAGVPLVVGMQAKIRERAAAVFDVALLGGLADGLPVDRAVTHARRQLHLRAGDRLDWVAPVLYTAGASLAPLLAAPAWTTGQRPELAGLAVSNVGGLASVDRYDLSSRRMNVQQTVEVLGSPAARDEAGEAPPGSPPGEDADLDFSFGTPDSPRPVASTPPGGRRGIDEPPRVAGPPFRLAGPSGDTAASPAAPLAAGDQLDRLRAAIVNGRQTPRQKIEALALVERLGFALADGDMAAARQLLRTLRGAAPLQDELIATLSQQLDSNQGGS